jgi:predicted GNAT family acetyltransferase
MELYEETSVKTDSFKEAWKIYEDSFPEDERRNLQQQDEVLKNKHYKFYSINDGKEVIGMMGVWKLEHSSLIEHIAIKKDMRNKGFGSKVVQDYIASGNIFVVEIEPPEWGEMEKRRMDFWKRNRFNPNEHNYIQPAYDETKKPLPLVFMSYPKEVDEKEFEKIRDEIHLEVYGMKEPVLKI